MSDPTPKQSARIIGLGLGLTAVETNQLLKEEGFLDGGPGMYTVTEKGRPFADEQHHSRGTGGYARFNPQWEQRTWDPSITDAIDLTAERKQQVREAARAVRLQQAAERAAQAVELDRPLADSDDAHGVSQRHLAVLVLGLAIASASIYGIYKGAPHLTAWWSKRAAPSSETLTNPSAGDAEQLPGPVDPNDEPSS